MRLSDVLSGYAFPPSSVTLDAATVRAYLAATDDDNALYWHDTAPPISAHRGTSARAPYLVPPLGVAALAFRDLVDLVTRQPGSLHTGQELTFHRPIRVGERLTTRAQVAASSRRRGITALVVEIAVVDDSDDSVLSGRMTLMVAEADERQNPPPAARPEGQAEPEVVLAEYAVIPAEVLAAGYDLGTLARTVTQERIDRYALASGDFNPIHVDHAFAAATPFGGTVAHGMLLLADMSCLLTRRFGLAWLAGGSLRMKLRNPAPAGSEVVVRGQIERLEEAGDGVQYAVCALRLENGDGGSLITGEARVPPTQRGGGLR
jgi:3-hydroxybutyryl-CoA dehydratase